MNEQYFKDVSFLFFIYRLPISYEIVFLIILKTRKEIIACLTDAIIGCLQTFLNCVLFANYYLDRGTRYCMDILKLFINM